MLARPRGADDSEDDRLLLKWSTNPKDSDSWSCTIVINLPNGWVSGPNSATLLTAQSKLYIEWAEKNVWVIGFTDAVDGKLKLMTIDLFEELIAP
jgi:hypothetical protein